MTAASTTSITGFNVPRGSWGAKVLDEVAPQGDEIVLPKSSYACATYSVERHEQSLAHISGYCRQLTTAELLAELGRPPVGQEATTTQR